MEDLCGTIDEKGNSVYNSLVAKTKTNEWYKIEYMQHLVEDKVSFNLLELSNVTN